MIASSDSADVCTPSASSRCSGESSVDRSSVFMPSTPFIGVRISWLIAARNALLAADACSARSASSRARSSSTPRSSVPPSCRPPDADRLVTSR